MKESVEMITFEANTQIDRPVEDVFAFVADGRNGALWNSAVKEVRRTSEGPVGVGATYWMARDLPQGRVENTYQIGEFEPNRALTIRTTSGPTPFVYRYTFEPAKNGTRITLNAEVDLGVANLLGPVAGRAVKSGVQANFATLKRLLES